MYGRRKQGAARNRQGQMSYAPHVAFWAERGRALTAELVGGNREKLSGAECARIATRALGLLPAGHGPATLRIDSAYYQLELLERLRRERTRFTVSVPRNQAMWKALAEIAEDAWQDALDMPGAQVAETTYRPEGWKHEPLRLIVRRVAVHRRADRPPEGLPAAEDDPPRAAAAGARRAARLRLRLQLHPHRHPPPAAPPGSSTSTATARRSKSA